MLKFSLIVIFIYLLSSLSAEAYDNRGIAKVCENYEKVSSILIPYTEQAWPGVSATPVGPVPTVTMFTLAARQPIIDFCSFIIQLNNLTAAEGVFATANYGNRLLDNQHSEKISFLRDTYDLGTALNSFSQGDGDVSKAHSLHRRINAYLKTADKMMNGDNAKTFENRMERERKMANLVRSSNKVATYKKAINCPQPKIDESEKNMDFFNKEIVPLYPLIEEREEDVAYFLAQLQFIGTLISSSYEEHQEYQKKLYEVFGKGVNFRKGPPKTKSVKSAGGSQGEIKRIKITYFEYGAVMSPVLFSNFQKDYHKDWNSYVISQIRTKGLLTNPMSITARQFRDTSYECRRSKIEWNLRRTNPIYQYEQSGSSKFSTEVDRKVEECKKGLVINEKRVENLFNHYVGELKQNLLNYKNLQARVWSYDSEFLGMNRNIAVGVSASDLGEISQEDVKCETNLNITEQTDLKNRIESETLEMRAMMAEELTKKTVIMEAESRAKAQSNEETRRSSVLNSEENKRKDKIEDSLQKPSTDIAF